MLNNRKIKLKIKEKKVIEKHITTEFIRLDAFLKLCDAVQSGGTGGEGGEFLCQESRPAQGSACRVHPLAG